MKNNNPKKKQTGRQQNAKVLVHVYHYLLSLLIAAVILFLVLLIVAHSHRPGSPDIDPIVIESQDSQNQKSQPYLYTQDGQLPYLICQVSAPDLTEIRALLSIEETFSPKENSQGNYSQGEDFQGEKYQWENFLREMEEDNISFFDINHGVPFFTREDLQLGTILLSPLDDLGRCGACMMIAGPETLQAGSRSESAGQVKPSGWHQSKYPGIVDSDPPYLMNRCHLLMWEMTGFTSTPENLMSGTRQMNVDMLETELSVVSYIESTAGHVLYRATPVFCEDELFARGILIEAQSVEDEGKALSICRFYPNTQEGILIDYATGENHLK